MTANFQFNKNSTSRYLSIATLSLCSAAVLADQAQAPSAPKYGLQRIVGGENAAEKAYPWMAALVNPGTTGSDSQFCGATLIKPMWVMTAAHCVEGSDPSQIEVMLGVNNLTSDKGERIKVSKIVSHPDYLNQQKPDIALLQLATASKQTPVTLLPEQNTLEKAGTAVRAIGWGVTDGSSNEDTRSPNLKQVDLQLTSHAACNSAYNGQIDESTMICAGVPEGGKDSCYGDSGGPLIIPGNPDQQVGIVSFGEDCGAVGFPGVYSRVSQLNKWITAAVAGQPGTPSPNPNPGEQPIAQPGTDPDLPVIDTDDQFPIDPDTDIVFDPCNDPELSAEWGEFFADFCANDSDIGFQPGGSGDGNPISGMPGTGSDSTDDNAPISGVFEQPVTTATPAASYSQTYSGSLMSNDDAAFFSEEGFAVKAGTLTAKLTVPQGADFLLALDRFDKASNTWETVAISDQAGNAAESISYKATEGVYSWVVAGVEGKGAFTLTAKLDANKQRLSSR